MSYENDTIRPDARLIILKALAAQTNKSLHSNFLAKELLTFGIDRPRAWIHAELDWLAEMGAVTLLKPGSVVVATLTEKGARHLRMGVEIPGIDRPGLSES